MNKLEKYKYQNPLSVLDAQDEFLTPLSKVFDKFFEDTFPSFQEEFGMNFMSNSSFPRVDVIDQENQVLIEAEIPGLTKDEVSVEVNNGVLTIRGEKRSNKKEEKKGTYVYRELKKSSFSRSFSLNANYDTDKIDAKFNNGLLEVAIPKKVPTPIEPPKKVEIK